VRWFEPVAVGANGYRDGSVGTAPSDFDAQRRRARSWFIPRAGLIAQI